jgi:hypothetical protein
MTTRAVSNPVGVILILGMTVLSVGALLAVGGAVIDDTRADAERSQMGNAMASFASKASLVGLGESGHQRFALGRTTAGRVDVREDAGRVDVYIEQNGTNVTVADTTMGALVYEQDGREIAYQGGGVWERQGDFSRMRSPPEFHYRAETLTFPIINVTGSGSVSGDVRGSVQSQREPTPLYPNVTEDEDFENPLTNGTVYVEIESDYCRGWQSFFESRTQGGIEEGCEDGDAGAVVVDLTVALDPTFGTAVTAGRIDNDGATISSTREGIKAPSASSRIEDRIDDCKTNGCNEWTSSPTGGTYYTETGDDFGGLNIDTNDDVDLVINDLTGGVDISSDITVSGTGNVNVYLRTDGDITMGGSTSINDGGNPDQFIMYVHSDVPAIKLTGSPTYVGGIYAPNTAMEGDQGGGGGCGAGNVEVIGSVVVDNFCFRNGEFTHDPSMEDIEPDISADTVKYLHVSENRVDVELN